MYGTHVLARYKRRTERKREREFKRGKERRALAAKLKAIRIACFVRDNGRCRACLVPVYLAHENPFLVGHCHHIIYRSAGGKDTLENRIMLCVECHSLEHDSTLLIAGDPNAILTFTVLDKARQIHKVWDSPCAA